MRTPAPGTRPLLLLTAVGVALLTGCAAHEPAPAPTGPATTTVAPSATAPTAADGTNLDACRDGTCEVLLDGPATIPVPRSTGFLSLQVVRDGAELALSWTTAGGGGGTATGTAYAHIAEGTTAELAPAPDGAVIVKIHPE